MSVRQIGIATKLSSGHISDVLNGWKAPSPATAAKIASTLGAKPDDIAKAVQLAESLRELNRYNRRVDRESQQGQRHAAPPIPSPRQDRASWPGQNGEAADAAAAGLLPDRVVRVSAGRDGQAEVSGTGYLIAPRLVLTAGSLAEAAAGDYTRATVQGAGCAPGSHDAVVRWWQSDHGLDAALIEVTGAGWAAPASWSGRQTPQRFGEFVTAVRAHRVTAQWIPPQPEGSGPAAPEQLDGWITAGTAAASNRYDITGDGSPPEPPPGSTGAAAFSGGLLVAVMSGKRAEKGSSGLASTRMRDVLQIAEARELISTHSGRFPIAEPAELASLLEVAASAHDLRSPATLLRAEVKAVRFRGRAAERVALQNWCLKGKPSLAVRVLTGPGGQGKTRLANWLAESVSTKGWPVGYLRAEFGDASSRPADALDHLAQVSGQLLIVVDYAESRPVLIRRLAEAAMSAPGRIRLLLVARVAGLWLKSPMGAPAIVHELLATARETPLEPLDTTVAARREAFKNAALSLARLLGKVDGQRQFDWPRLVPQLKMPSQIGSARYQTALSVQMAALVELLQNGPAPVSAGAEEPVEAILLLHEQRYWDRTASAEHLDTMIGVPLERAVAAACLCGAADEDQATSALGRLSAVPAGKALAVALWLARLYPAPTGQYWGSLQPDRVAEYHAAAVVTGTPGLLTALLTGAAPSQQIQAVAVLTRAAIAHTNAGRVAESVNVINTLNATLRTVDPTLPVLQASHAALPFSSQALASFAVQMAEDVAALYRRMDTADRDTYDDNLATALHNLAIDYAGVGQHDDALTTIREAVDIRRGLAAADPDTHLGDLVSTLYVFASENGEAGRFQEGLAAIEEAVKIARKLAAANWGAYLPSLTSSLNCMSALLANLGRPTESLAVIREVVALRRHLAAEDPDAFDDQLAESLQNLSVACSDVGLLAESAAAIEEAVTIRRRMAELNPDAYEGDLATELNTLAIGYSDCGRFTQGLAAAQESVSIRRRLTAANPGAYEGLLAASLTTLASAYAELGRPAEGLDLAEEAVRIFRRLAEANPGVYLSRLEAALTCLGNRYGDLGRHPEALAAGEEVLAICRQLATVNQDVYLSNVALALNNLSIAYGHAGRDDDGVVAAQEAVLIRRQLAAARPGEHEPGLASSLNNLSVRYSCVEQPAQAQAASEEAAAIWRRLADSHPGSYQDDLAITLYNLSFRYAEAGRLVEGIAAARESVAVRRQQMVNDPDTRKAELAVALGGLAKRYREAGRYADQEAAAREALANRRQLAAADPDVHLPDVAQALADLADACAKAGHPDDSVAAAREAVAIGRQLVTNSPGKYGSFLASSLNNLSVRLPTENIDEAVAAIEESVAVWRRLTHDDPGRYDGHLAVPLGNLSSCYARAGRSGEAVAAAEEAVAIRRRDAGRDPDSELSGLALSLETLADRYLEAGRNAEHQATADEAEVIRQRLAGA